MNLPVEVGGGVRVSGDLILDPKRVFSKFCFVSHAHSDHLVAFSHPGCEVHATKETSQLAGLRLKRRAEVVEHEFLQTFELSGARAKLFPSGHVLGSAQLKLEVESETVVYTGDLKLRKTFTQEGCEPLRCDVLLIESVYGHPAYVFPSAEEVGERIKEWAKAALEANAAPVLLGNPLGQGQELTKILSEEFEVVVYPSIAKLNEAYEAFGIRLGSYGVSTEPLPKKVFVAPSWLSKQLRGSRLRRAVCTGWAVDKRIKRSLGVEEAFPLSNHADFWERVKYVEKAKPGVVLTCHRYFYKEFAAWLRENLGVDAKPIEVLPQRKLSSFSGCLDQRSS